MRQTILACAVGGLFTVLLWSSCAMADEPTSEFLSSYVLVRPGILDLGPMPVETFIEILEKNVLDDGSHPEFLGWTVIGNRHIARVRFMENEIPLVFVHQPGGSEATQTYSLLQPIKAAGQTVDPLLFSRLFF